MLEWQKDGFVNEWRVFSRLCPRLVSSIWSWEMRGKNNDRRPLSWICYCQDLRALLDFNLGIINEKYFILGWGVSQSHKA
jgi:hypothetical protein